MFYRGEGKNNDEAFRDYFSKIGQLRSLSLNVSILSLTATASPTNRKRIMKRLAFRENNVVIIDSPDRPNIKINVKCVKNVHGLSIKLPWRRKTWNDMWYFVKALKTEHFFTACL